MSTGNAFDLFLSINSFHSLKCSV